MKLREQFKAEIERFEIPERAAVLVAVSGGVDSMALLHLCLSVGLKPRAAHANFKLRAEESDEDARFVRNFCEQFGIPCFQKEMPIGTRTGVQEKARELRYSWFAEIMEGEKIRFLMTAHHLNDRVETFLINLLRGSGLKGLKSIPERNFQTVRPLLRFRKAELIQYARAEKLSWREDSSNQSNVYLRNQIRNEVIPVLEKINETAIVNIGNSLEFLAEADEYLKREAGRFIARQESDGFFCKIYDSDWDSLFSHPPLPKYVFDELGFEPGQLEALSRLRFSESGKKVEGKRYDAFRDRESIILKLKGSQHRDGAQLANPLGGEITDPICLSWATIPSPESLKLPPFQAYLDADRLSFPLAIRPWREGDGFRPLGMKGKKKISDFLVDEKIPLATKDQVYVLISEDKIAWVMGHRISEDFKVTSSTKRVIHFRML